MKVGDTRPEWRNACYIALGISMTGFVQGKSEAEQMLPATMIGVDWLKNNQQAVRAQPSRVAAALHPLSTGCSTVTVRNRRGQA